jgi:hypothetical protein
MVGCNVVVDNSAHHTLREAFRDGQDLGMNVGEPGGGTFPATNLLDTGF